MGSTAFPIFMLMLATAVISIWLGYKIGSTPIPEEFLQEIREKAFEAAKEEYIQYFQKRFNRKGLALSNEYIRRLQFENRELIKQNKELVKELEKERKKNESIGSD
jgi:hypothetical protein